MTTYFFRLSGLTVLIALDTVPNVFLTVLEIAESVSVIASLLSSRPDSMILCSSSSSTSKINISYNYPSDHSISKLMLAA